MAERIDPAILALYADRATTVLEVIAAFLAHEGIADSTQVEPGMRELVDEQWPGVEEVDVVKIFPLIGERPSVVAINRMRWRTQRQHIQHDRLAVAFPVVL